MSHVPMSRPQEMLACHDPFLLTRGACIALKSGRVVCGSGCRITYSDDGGMSWCDPYEGTFADGTRPSIYNLVELSDGSLGGVEIRSRPGAPMPIHETEALFTVSKDLGKTWSEPRQMSDMRLRASAFFNALMRTSSGRIILPVQFGLGRDRWHKRGAPFVGGYIDGELFILLEPDGHMVGNFEPSVVETAPNTLLMFLRSKLGRVFQSWSTDNGETWTYPEPTHLAASNSPNILTRLPATGHVLAVWNQQSEQEIQEGYVRTRLSAAVSRNGGGSGSSFRTWSRFMSRPTSSPARSGSPGRRPATPSIRDYRRWRTTHPVSFPWTRNTAAGPTTWSAPSKTAF